MKMMSAAALAALLLLPGRAMAIDFSQALKAPDGTPMQECAGRTCHALLLRDVISNSLLLPQAGDDSLSLTQHARLTALGGEVTNAKGDTSLSADDIDLIKARVGLAYPPTVTAQASAALDAKP